MTHEIQAVVPGDSTIPDARSCCVYDCRNAVGLFTNGSDQDGYTIDFAPGWVVQGAFYCAEHHHIAVEMTGWCVHHGEVLVEDSDFCNECFAEVREGQR